MDKVLVIVLKNGRKVVWTPIEYDDYSYDGEAFIVKKNGEWVGIYNIDSIVIAVTKDKEE